MTMTRLIMAMICITSLPAVSNAEYSTWFGQSKHPIDSYTIALHGIEMPHEQWLTCMNSICALLDREGYEITDFGYNDNGTFTKVLKNNLRRRNRLRNVFSTVSDIRLYGRPTEKDKKYGSNKIALELKINKKQLVLSIADESNPNNAKRVCQNIMAKYIGKYTFQYGYEFEFPFRLQRPVNWITFPNLYYRFVKAPIYKQQLKNLGDHIRAWYELENCGYLTQPLLKEIFPINYINEDWLDNSIHGQPLRQLIEVGSLGQLSKLENGMWQWTVSATQWPTARQQLLQEGWLTTLEDAKEKTKPYYEMCYQQAQLKHKNRILPTPEQMTLRNKLVKSLNKQRGPNLVTLDQYFTGNWENGTFAPNDWGLGLPQLDIVYKRLKELEAKNDINHILVVISDYDMEMRSALDENDCGWPIAEQILIVTSLPRDNVEALAETVWHPLVIENHHDPNVVSRVTLPKNHKLYTFYWD